jgi:Arc/MetJ family transcription regulator
LDDALLAQAQAALGTGGIRDTIEGAFREVVRRRLRDRLAERIRTGEGVDRGPALLDASRPQR